MPIPQSFREVVPLRVAVALAASGLAATMATHTAVLTGRLPHTAVSGARVTDPAAGQRLAVTSSVSLVPVAALVARGAGFAGGSSRAERAVMGALAVAALGSVPAQATGTAFERRFMAPTAVALAVGLGRLALERD